VTQTETIRAFRRTWKPKAPKRAERRAFGPRLVPPCGTVECTSTRQAEADVLPPLSPAARSLLSAPTQRPSVTGVWRKPEAPPSLLKRDQTLELDPILGDASLEFESRPIRARAVPPPLPSASFAHKRRNAREPTDHQIDLLTVYKVPPVPSFLRARQATPPADPSFIEITLDELMSAHEDREPAGERSFGADLTQYAERVLGWTLLPRVFGLLRR